MRTTLIEVLLYLGLGALIMWYLLPNKIVEIPGLNSTEYPWIRDTVKVKDTAYFETIKVQKIVIISIKDTTYNDSIPTPINLIAEYDRITNSLVSLSFARMKYYSKITNTNDTVSIHYESIRDSIIELEIKLAAREVIKNEIRTVFVPNKSDEEEWWIKPSIIAGSIIVGYGLGSIK
jgi:hypothetical protein